jgi:hypothetical protein
MIPGVAEKNGRAKKVAAAGRIHLSASSYKPIIQLKLN